ncbi:16269_t:CDS:1, partial [Acaulospora colombiana]
MSIAITRIGPAIMPIFAGTGSATPGEWEQERTALYAVVKQVTEIAARLDREISRMIYTELKAAHGEVEETLDTMATAAEPQASNAEVSATPAKTAPLLSESDRATSFIPSPGSSKKTQRNVSSNSALRTPATQGRVSNSTATAGLGGMELDNNIMRLLSKEVEDMVIEKNIKRHPMLARIWNEAVGAGRIAFEREREAKLFGAQQAHQPVSQSQTTTAVDISQQLHPFPNSRTSDNDSAWKSSYMQRRARSEEHSASPPPNLSKPALGPISGITNTPPPSALRNLSRQGSDVERLSHTRWSSASSSYSGLPRTGSDLAKRVDAERARLLRELASDQLASSPGPDLNLTGRPNGLLQQHHHHRLSAGDPFPVLPKALETPSPESSRSDLDPIVGAIRSRSMSL